MKARNGGDAFPSPGVVLMNEGGMPQQQGAYAGMTLRDYFAAHAPPPPKWWLDCYLGQKDLSIDAETMAQWALCYADAMLKAREA